MLKPTRKGMFSELTMKNGRVVSKSLKAVFADGMEVQAALLGEDRVHIVMKEQEMLLTTVQAQELANMLMILVGTS